MMSALHDIRVLDLSRVLAGPFCTQVLGDLGADILKIEKPGAGDDTRKWGPPFLKDDDGQDTTESAYYLSTNRNKKSLAIDITTTQGQEIIHSLLERSDVLIQNFKTEGLDKYGLGYKDIEKRHPHIIYCAITGFGQTGPLAHEPGYDFLAQALSGMMAHTGAPSGAPMKIGVALSDIMTGLYAAIGILSALHARKTTGKGQMVDLALLDCTLASMTNIAQYFLTSGQPAPRQGNAHASIVPYQAFAASDGHIIIAVGNDRQFGRLCSVLGSDEWAGDERFATNAARVQNRDTLCPIIAEHINTHPVEHWMTLFLERDVPAAPVQSMDQVFDMPQIIERNMKIQMQHPEHSDPIDLIGNPLKLSDTPVNYTHAPPILGQHTDVVLQEILEMDEKEIESLKKRDIIGA
jgi:crotonobetainyl-CoA:carnitine CoA-transferase CaiB-like acyl-CoA transferase